MVKNMLGGCKTKSQGRKFANSVSYRSALRLSTCNLEVYACVTKHYGQGRCCVKTVEDKELQCVIRNKFKGRSKRNNLLVIGSIVLVGLREWENTDNYKICDLLEVYDEEDQSKLRNIPGTKINMLDRYAQNLNNNNVVVDGEVVFSNEVDNYDEIDNKSDLKLHNLMKCDENIDIDDI